MDIESARILLKQHNQEQLMRFSDQLSEQELGLLLNDVANIDFEELAAFWKEEQRSSAEEQPPPPMKMEPVPMEACGSVLRNKGDVKEWEEIGEFDLRIVSNTLTFQHPLGARQRGGILWRYGFAIRR